MSMKQYPWDLEERAEDAIVAYLKATVGRATLVRAAREVIDAKFPLITVATGDCTNNAELANFNGLRRFDVVVIIQTEGVNYNEELGQAEILETAREAHRAVKSDAIGSLASTVLHEDLNALQPQGIVFSQAHLTTQSRGVEEGLLTTRQTLDVIACPKEI